MYNFVGSVVLGYYVGVSLGVSLGGDTGWEERISVDLEPVGTPTASLGNSNCVRGRL